MTGCAAAARQHDARPRVIKETPVSALVDGDGGLGHLPARFAMQVAIEKAKQSGVAVAAVRSSAHFGATGYYTLMAAKEGLIGMACTSASSTQVAPTFGKEGKAPNLPPVVQPDTMRLLRCWSTVRASLVSRQPAPVRLIRRAAGLPQKSPSFGVGSSLRSAVYHISMGRSDGPLFGSVLVRGDRVMRSSACFPARRV